MNPLSNDHEVCTISGGKVCNSLISGSKDTYDMKQLSNQYANATYIWIHLQEANFERRSPFWVNDKWSGHQAL